MQAEDRQVQSVQTQAQQARSHPQQKHQPKEIRRRSIEMDGVLARLRRGSVPMEHEDRRRTGDVSRAINVGAVCRAERGPKRSELVPGVDVETPTPHRMRSVAHHPATGGCDWFLSHLAVQGGLEQAQQVVVLGDGAPWIWKLAAETRSRGGADGGSLSRQRTGLGGGSRCLSRSPHSGHSLGHHRVFAAGRRPDG